MAKIFIDTEFLEGKQAKKLLGFKYGETKPSIDLISIGLVSEDGREYYAISKDFNLRESRDRYEQRTGEGDRNNIEPKVYWIRENVLRPIFEELKQKEKEWYLALEEGVRSYIEFIDADFTYQHLRYLIKQYGKTNKEIAEEVFRFVHYPVYSKWDDKISFIEEIVDSAYQQGEEKHEFYGYYADYDWVVFAWLWREMIDLPTGFPMFCNDLKQTLDEKAKTLSARVDVEPCVVRGLSILKSLENYPKQQNAHNALADARWNLELYKLLKTI